MKKWTVLCLCILLVLAAGCAGASTQTGEPAAQTAEPAEAAEVITVTPPEEDVPLVQLTSLDYDQAAGQVLVNVVRMQFKGDETDYQIVADGEGATEQLKLSKTALIDFPLRDDPAHTVTVLADEFIQEYTDYMAANEGAALLFTMTEAGGEITALSNFYTP